MLPAGNSIKDRLALIATAIRGVLELQGYAEYSSAPQNYPAFQFSDSFSLNLPYDHHRISFEWAKWSFKKWFTTEFRQTTGVNTLTPSSWELFIFLYVQYS